MNQFFLLGAVKLTSVLRAPKLGLVPLCKAAACSCDSTSSLSHPALAGASHPAQGWGWGGPGRGFA